MLTCKKIIDTARKEHITINEEEDTIIRGVAVWSIGANMESHYSIIQQQLNLSILKICKVSNVKLTFYTQDKFDLLMSLYVAFFISKNDRCAHQTIDLIEKNNPNTRNSLEISNPQKSHKGYAKLQRFI